MYSRKFLDCGMERILVNEYTVVLRFLVDVEPRCDKVVVEFIGSKSDIDVEVVSRASCIGSRECKFLVMDLEIAGKLF